MKSLAGDVGDRKVPGNVRLAPESGDNLLVHTWTARGLKPRFRRLLLGCTQRLVRQSVCQDMNSRQRASCRCNFTPAQLDRPVASARDFASGGYTEPLPACFVVSPAHPRRARYPPTPAKIWRRFSGWQPAFCGSVAASTNSRQSSRSNSSAALSRARCWRLRSAAGVPDRPTGCHSSTCD